MQVLRDTARLGRRLLSYSAGAILRPFFERRGEEEVREAARRFYWALERAFVGDLAPMEGVWSHEPDVTNAGPFGGRQVGWDEVRAQFERESHMGFSGRITCDDELVRADGELGVTIGLERGVGFTRRGERVKVEHRVTNVFRRERGEWRLIHHHTDLVPMLDTGPTRH